MNNFKLLFFILAFFLVGSLQASDHMPRQLIIKIEPQYLNLCFDDSIAVPEVFDLLEGNTYTFQRKFPHATPPVLRKKNAVELRTIYEFTFAHRVDLNKLISRLNNSKYIQYAEKRYIDSLAYTPNDPRYNDGDQAYLDVVHAESAWDIQKGDSSISVAVLDVGSQLDHPDLKNKMAVNENDPVNGSDSDGNGYPDDYYGWDFYNDDHLPEQSGSENHGTHVAGLAAAQTDNNTGIASLGFNTSFIPVKVGENNTVTHGYEGIVYAADRGAEIINCSWGGFSPSEYARDVVNYAFVNRDALIIGASGNNGDEAPFYPAAYENVFSVASSNNSGEPSSFSNYGYYVDISAPGQDLLSTVPGGGYNTNTGTSMAAPVVAAAAALVMAHFPNISPGQTIARLKASATSYSNFDETHHKYHKMGAGIVNPAQALQGSLNEPWFELASMNVSDSIDDLFSAGDTLRISTSFINYLDTSGEVEVVAVADSGLSALTDTVSYGIFNTSEQKDNRNEPFVFVIDQSTARDQVIKMEFTLNDGVNEQTFFRDIRVNPTFINVTVNRTATTATSIGRVGYNKRETDQGLGLRLNERNSILYSAGFMAGGINHSGDTLVVDAVRRDPDNDDRDFEPVNVIDRDLTADEPFFAQGSFSDTVPSNVRADSLGLHVEQTVKAYNDFGHDQYVLFEYEVTNASMRTITHLQIGMLADWDILNYFRNRSFEMSGRRTAATKSIDEELYGAVQLTEGFGFKSYAIDNEGNGGDGIEILNGFDTPKKFIALSNSRPEAGTQNTGGDVLQVISSGPYVLSPGDSRKVTFAFFAGESEQDLERLADSAAMRQTGRMFTGLDETVEHENRVRIWPNPFQDRLEIESLSKDLFKVDIYDARGRLVQSEKATGSRFKTRTSELPAGLYIVKIHTEDSIVTRKAVKR